MSPVRQRLLSIFGGSGGNLIEWYDFYVCGPPGPQVRACIFCSLLVYTVMPDTRRHGRIDAAS